MKTNGNRAYMWYYTGAWIILFGLFQVLAFLPVGWKEDIGTASFFVGYGLTVLSFVCQMILALIVRFARSCGQDENRQSVLLVSFVCLIVTFLIGGMCQMIPSLPYWIGGIACGAVSVVPILTVIRVRAALMQTESTDHPSEEGRSFLRALSVRAGKLMDKAVSEPVKTACRRVAEALQGEEIRHRPVSSREAKSLDGAFCALAEAVRADDAARCEAAAGALLSLIGRGMGQHKDTV